MSSSSSRRRPPRPERVMDNWERLVRAALKHQHRTPSAAASSAAGIGLASAVPPSLGKTTNIEHILQAADDIEDDRILCEQAYTMAQNLDPDSDGRGVLQSPLWPPPAAAAACPVPPMAGRRGGKRKRKKEGREEEGRKKKERRG